MLPSTTSIKNKRKMKHEENAHSSTTITPTDNTQQQTIIPYDQINEEWNKLIEQQLNEEETRKLKQFIDRLSVDYCHEVKSTVTLVRFLRARNWDLDKAETMFRARMDWVTSYKPLSITMDMCKQELKSGVAYWAGVDKHMRPTLRIRACLNDPSTYKREDFYRSVIFVLELGLKNLPPPPYNQYIVMYDMHNVSRKNMDLGSLRQYSSLGDHYPEYLGKVYVMRPHWMLSIFFSVIRTIMEPVTLSKVQIVKQDELHKLLDDYEPDQLDEDLGGTGAGYEIIPDYRKL
jgi:hypothetical protein